VAVTVTRSVRVVVGVLLAVAAGGFIWPAVPVALFIGGLAFTGTEFGAEPPGATEPDPVSGIVWTVGTLLLAAAPVVLGMVVIRPPRTVAGWIASIVFLATTGAVIVYWVVGGFTGAWMQGWFDFWA
jgi:hypothetical protein